MGDCTVREKPAIKWNDSFLVRWAKENPPDPNCDHDKDGGGTFEIRRQSVVCRVCGRFYGRICQRRPSKDVGS